jgi:hypothetical protein
MCSKDKPNLEEVEELALHHVDGGLSTPMREEWILLVEVTRLQTGTP